MSHDTLDQTSACDLGRLIETGAVNPMDLTEELIEKAQNHPLAPRIYVRLTAERARAEAKAAAERAKFGVRKHLLDGVPVSWKDLFDVAGVPTEGGSKLCAGHMAHRDADVVSHASVLGSICLGKTHLSELAFSGLGYNPTVATSPCIHDPDRVAGGSSSGAASSVAYGLAPAAIGSDTGGSVRIPAAWNNLVGFKPTHTTKNMGGVRPLAPSLDTIGPLCKTVEDAMALHALVHGGQAPRPVHTDAKARLGIITNAMFQQTQAPISKAFDQAIEALRRAGHDIIEFQDPMLDEALDLGTYMTAEAYSAWHEVIEAQPDLVFPEILARFRQGSTMTSADYAGKISKLKVLREQLWQKTQGLDGLILPTTPILPPKIKDLANDGAYYRKSNMQALLHTRLGNALGCCGLTLPTSSPSVGFMIMGRPHTDHLILQRGYELARTILSS